MPERRIGIAPNLPEGLTPFGHKSLTAPQRGPQSAPAGREGSMGSRASSCAPVRLSGRAGFHRPCSHCLHPVCSRISSSKAGTRSGNRERQGEVFPHSDQEPAGSFLMPNAEHDPPMKMMVWASSLTERFGDLHLRVHHKILCQGGASSLRLRMTIGSIQELLARARGKAPGGASGGRAKQGIGAERA